MSYKGHFHCLGACFTADSFMQSAERFCFNVFKEQAAKRKWVSRRLNVNVTAATEVDGGEMVL